jgi:hypothetical protein
VKHGRAAAGSGSFRTKSTGASADRPPWPISRPSISTGAKIGSSAQDAAKCSGPIRGPPRAVSKTTRSPPTTSVAATLSLVSPPFSRSKSSSSGSRSRSGSRS